MGRPAADSYLGVRVAGALLIDPKRKIQASHDRRLDDKARSEHLHGYPLP
jgi:hypothetical protein